MIANGWKHQIKYKKKGSAIFFGTQQTQSLDYLHMTNLRLKRKTVLKVNAKNLDRFCSSLELESYANILSSDAFTCIRKLGSFVHGSFVFDKSQQNTHGCLLKCRNV